MRIYVAGPLSNGGKATASEQKANLARAVALADLLLVAGHAPYLPHLNVLWNQFHLHPEDLWMRLDLDWLPWCECLVWLAGESANRDREVEEARRQGIPVLPAEPRRTLLARLAIVEKEVGQPTPAPAKRRHSSKVWRAVRDREVGSAASLDLDD